MDVEKIQIASGALGGLRDVAHGVDAFLGIPYAAPPLGALRWKPPHPVDPWQGMRDAAKFAKRCIQHAPYGELEPDSPGMNEDCLYLNVWTPDTKARLPVLFWIHGGEFWAGSGSEPRYRGGSLAARGIVVVTVNHRLGVFGFLSHPELSRESDTGLSGNYGLLDLVAALNWTKENIASFGGDPTKVTVAGESAGSCVVSFLMASPISRNLFRSAIGESGSYFMPEPHVMKPLSHDDNEARGVQFASAAGASSLVELRAMSGERILEVWRKDPTKRMQPCIDDHVMPRVEDVFAERRQAQVPLLLGWNGDEYGFFRSGHRKFDERAFRKTLAEAFGASGAEALLRAYGETDTFDASTRLASDRAMVWPTWKWAEEQARIAQVYVYQFDRAAPGHSLFGALHASEIEYVFGTLDSKQRQYENADVKLSERMGKYWTNFVINGDPNGPGLTNWPRYGADRAILHLDADITAQPLDTTRLEVLSRLYSRM